MAHIIWRKNKMKVKHPAQTLSASTANALGFFKNIDLPKFSNVNTTVKYCRVEDQIFYY